MANDPQASFHVYIAHNDRKIYNVSIILMCFLRLTKKTGSFWAVRKNGDA